MRFVRNVLEDPERADEIADESLEHYAERRKIQIVNPRSERMASNEQLKQRIRELEEENDDLQDQLDQIADIAAPIEDDDDGDQEDQDDNRARPTGARSNPRRRSQTGPRDIEPTRRNARR